MIPAILALVTLPMAQPSPKPFLSPMFSDHMVLQRDVKNTFWGWTKPGAKVTVSISGKSVTGVADGSGKWSVKLTPPPVGGPYSVEIKGGQIVTLNDVLVGDVWLCSGQSNMEQGIGMVRDAEKEIAAANYPNIRLFLHDKVTALRPQELARGLQWRPCSPETVAQGGWSGFSGVGYFFGRELHQSLKVPIGLIESSWGGTVAEAWTSTADLRPIKDFNQTLDQIDLQNRPGEPSATAKLAAWSTKNDPLDAASEPSYDDSSWEPAVLPSGAIAADLNGYDGAIWYRKNFNLATIPTDDPLLTFGQADDVQSVYINGKLVAEAFSASIYLQRYVAKSAFRAGANTIAVRLINQWGNGGFWHSNEHYNIRFTDGKYLELGGANWKRKKSTRLGGTNFPTLLDDNPNVPTALYNGMIAPIAPLAIKGAIWYQGESNVGRPGQYEKILQAMIGNWRRAFGVGDFPFYIVQLANYSSRSNVPIDNAWADLREAQARIAEAVKNSGLAVAIDIGEREDIHPRNKQDVGKRLALQALSKTYNKANIICSGPVFSSALRKGNVVVVKFKHAEKMRLASVANSGFALAGADGKFAWATPTIVGDSVYLTCSAVTDPKRVRYAWDADPFAALFNGSGLPAVPFQAEIK